MTRRIAILGTRGIPARYGGFETFAQELSVRLAQRGVDVTVFCEDDGGSPRPASFGPVHLEYVPRRQLGGLSTIVFDLQSLWRARRGFDVVYMLGYGASVFCWIPRVWGTEVWINMDGVEWARSKWSAPARAYLRLMERIAMFTPSRVIADAEGIRAHLVQRHRRIPACSMIPYGARLVTAPPAPGPLAEWGLSPDGYYIVVCRLEPENHVLEIIEGYARSESPHPLVVLGDHRSGTAYVQRLLEVRDPRVRLVGTVYDDAKLLALRYHARGYFHGHSVGGTNPSLLEAMGAGNAIIAHDNVFNREVAGAAAVYFAGTADLPAVVQDLERDPAARARMRDVALERVRTRYDWELIADAYAALLDRSRTRGARAA